MATLTIELPDALAEEARTKGLLAPGAIEAMIRDALRRSAAGISSRGSLRGSGQAGRRGFPPHDAGGDSGGGERRTLGETAT